MGKLEDFCNNVETLTRSSEHRDFIDISIHIINTCNADYINHIMNFDPKSDRALGIIRSEVENIKNIDQETQSKIDEFLNKILSEMDSIKNSKKSYRDSSISATNKTGISSDEFKYQCTDANIIVATISAIIVGSIGFFADSRIAGYAWSVFVGVIVVVILIYAKIYKYNERKNTRLWEISEEKISNFGKLAKYRWDLMNALEEIALSNKIEIVKKLINEKEPKGSIATQHLNLFLNRIKYPIKRDACKLIFGSNGGRYDLFEYDGFVFNSAVASKIDHYIKYSDSDRFLASSNNSTILGRMRSQSFR